MTKKLCSLTIIAFWLIFATLLVYIYGASLKVNTEPWFYWLVVLTWFYLIGFSKLSLQASFYLELTLLLFGGAFFAAGNYLWSEVILGVSLVGFLVSTLYKIFRIANEGYEEGNVKDDGKKG